MTLALAFVALDALTAVQATLYVIQPSAGSTCSGGSPCTVQWLDDGTTPLNSNIGVTTCGLYTGDMQLVQTIDPVDVSSTQSLVFTPISDAGPDSSDYYIAFTSTNLEINGTKYTSYSPFFRHRLITVISLNNMTGSFSSSVASATSSIPIPSSLTGSSAFSETGVLSTVTVGTITTSSSTASSSSVTATIASSSKFSTSLSSSAMSSGSVSASSEASASSSTASGATSSNGAPSLRTASLTFFGVLSFTLILFL
ncbi:hypothetical protein EV368DRAFT_84777 [Lentinula lateritia]|uniref:Uncharacterized protein n=1 Tax=Lentinula aff. lateritia TaxID=2804960 RepID=A0ACC1U7H0_9AGAR|nr:hypothetical protein F5876DRAFT_74357 [Lentinula aff. lateritia]KAJ3850203.1 hypothetical protein EV368DRAFT_84777 [Lentinula lateritia]